MIDSPDISITGHSARENVDATGLGSVRAILFTRNGKGQTVSITSLKKWIRLARSVYKSEKADILFDERDIGLLGDLAVFCRQEGLRISPRIEPKFAPPDLRTWVDLGVLDVFLCPIRLGGDRTQDWLSAAFEASLPVRMQIHVDGTVDEQLLDAADTLNATLVNIAHMDPFASHGPAECENTDRIAVINRLAKKLASKNVPVSILNLPFCLLDSENLSHAENSPQFYGDCRQYQKPSYELAVSFHRLGPNRIDKVLENLLARRTSVHTSIDAALLPWLQDYPKLYIRTWMLHKLVRHLGFLKRGPRALPESVEAWDAELEGYNRAWEKKIGPTCYQCKYKRLCDHESEVFRSSFPTLPVRTEPGDPIADRDFFLKGIGAVLDEVDTARRRVSERIEKLAEEARHITTREMPTREISTDTYEIEHRYTHHMPGAVRWLSFGPDELVSTVLARLEPPFTLNMTVGGGIAEQVGFSFGRYAKIVCPMIDYSHRITLHVDVDGCYALLRDDRLVRPTEFEGERTLPPRLGGVLEPRISLHNIDGMILTQTLLLWEGASKPLPQCEGVKYSVIIISTRYTRRLQAALLSIAHQQGIDPKLIEVIVGYVPGIDATDDLLDGMRDAFPHLRIVRSPFAEGQVRAKGFMINESLGLASGEWILLLDADIVLPPDTFCRLEEESEEAHFLSPDGRKMLSPETTSRILLGEIRPWESFDSLLETSGEIRHREADTIPIGFFQCVRRDILRRVRYYELDHFESSDWLFGRDVVVTYGREKRLKDFNVLHLDHSGSQWYGTSKHR